MDEPNRKFISTYVHFIISLCPFSSSIAQTLWVLRFLSNTQFVELSSYKTCWRHNEDDTIENVIVFVVKSSIKQRQRNSVADKLTSRFIAWFWMLLSRCKGIIACITSSTSKATAQIWSILQTEEKLPYSPVLVEHEPMPKWGLFESQDSFSPFTQ